MIFKKFNYFNNVLIKRSDSEKGMREKPRIKYEKDNHLLRSLKQKTEDKNDVRDQILNNENTVSSSIKQEWKHNRLYENENIRYGQIMPSFKMKKNKRNASRNEFKKISFREIEFVGSRESNNKLWISIDDNTWLPSKLFRADSTVNKIMK